MMKVKPVKLGKTERMSFSHIDEVISMPNLIEVQKNSYQWFLDEGLKEVFHDIGTIEDYTGNLALSFVDFRLDKEPKYSIKECKERDVTYAAPLRVTARLLNKETGEVKDQEIFMGDFPLMTDAGTFVINGAERAIVSQLVRSPGVFYGDAKDKVGNDLYSATMNPNRGAWLEYETDAANVFYVRIDKNRKLPVTVLCRALGLSSDEEILNFFGEDERILATLEKDTTKNQDEGLLEVYRKLRPGEPPTVESATNQINMLFFDPRRYDLSRFGRYKMNKKLSLARRITGFVAAENIVAPLTGEIIVEAKGKITRELAEKADAAGVDTVILSIEGKKVKVITNGCVDAQGFFSFDVKECGINERCSFDEIKKILDTTSDVEEQKEMLRRNHDQLIGRTVTVTDISGKVLGKTRYAFTNPTPFYISIWAWLLYAAVLYAVVYYYIKWRTTRIVARNRKMAERELMQQKMKTLEQERIIAEQQKVILENELSVKGKDMASLAFDMATMKSSMENARESLIEGMRNGSISSRNANKILQQMKADNNDMFWATYRNNFDLIHKRFFRTLHEKYPDLTSNDLRLCALLRLNLNTKEIASFTRLSIRGVEGARYRLRKKFGIPTDKSLTDFLIEIE